MKKKILKDNTNLFINSYLTRLKHTLKQNQSIKIKELYQKLLFIWKQKRNLFICGNGGSASNANHIANDLLCVLASKKKIGLKVESLSSNPAVITCIANDKGYENIFSDQIHSKCNSGDLLIVLSGSGNSKNILNAIIAAKKMNVYTFGILGFDGGKSKKILDNFINFQVNDMQISEDIQMIVFNICLQMLIKKNIN